MTFQEIARIEQRLRLARSAVFHDDDAVAEAASKEIDECKALLEPVWQARYDAARHNADQRLLYSTD